MLWDSGRYQPSMRNLPLWVRDTAIEIANALLRQGRTEGSAIRIAIAQAKRWAGARAARLDLW
ncbi:hypothetical protein [Burkholderia ubonensis]|uniref:Uncharacterized protein n=1 Tax=Burkholderia ubonensis TaxID=101571 RepID=A0A119MT53_9BURK|nr:hypothetical protein [Burkholderia ubonensis]KWD74958.1 hypothetical protein WL70_26325 [Burkholderia ubonensis]KWD84202.1 hypothetical protein WL71_15060 [Burkholderia ubonensis]KWD97569.1 hypothetical protein WL72_19700 [Burkholderia ubonensis]KWE10665.1 hypothetical protein WL73_34640 [Burkholderia ubonensis]